MCLISLHLTFQWTMKFFLWSSSFFQFAFSGHFYLLLSPQPIASAYISQPCLPSWGPILYLLISYFQLILLQLLWTHLLKLWPLSSFSKFLLLIFSFMLEELIFSQWIRWKIASLFPYPLLLSGPNKLSNIIYSTQEILPDSIFHSAFQ